MINVNRLSGRDIVHYLKIIEVAIGVNKRPNCLTITVKVDTLMAGFNTSSRLSVDSEYIEL